MKRITVGTASASILCAAFLTLAPAGRTQEVTGFAAKAHIRSPFRPRAVPGQSRNLAVQSSLSMGSQESRLTAIDSPDIISVPCPPEATGLYPAIACGKLPVPLARQDPDGPKINIYFELYLHTNPGPAVSAIIPNIGGPGQASTGFRGLWTSTFAANLDEHDLLLIDNRGTGQSQAIDCNGLQHGTGTSLDQEIADCSHQLGESVVSYSSGDVAIDWDTVRDALGYQLVDIYGGSYGGADAIAYASRFGSHLRSLVGGSPFGPNEARGVNFVREEANATLQTKSLACFRSPTCAHDHPQAADDFQDVIEFLRRHPVTGEAYDANGDLLTVTVDEKVLEYITFIDFSNFYMQQNEIIAAGKALAAGDSLPILRIAAEFNGAYLPTSDSGDPTSYSNGDFYVAECDDLTDPLFSWSSSPQQRLAQFNEAMSDLPSNYFAPFSVQASSAPLIEVPPRQCVFMGRPRTPLPMVPQGAQLPNAPVLVLGSDIDLQVPASANEAYADLFPNGSYINIPGSPHEPVLNNTCANAIATHFIATLTRGDTSCARTPVVVFPAVGRFPTRAVQAVAAEPIPGNVAGEEEREVATVAVSTVTDAVKRAVYGNGTGVCLRGGTFSTAVGPSGYAITLDECSFSEDVQVSGTISYVLFSSLSASLAVSGTGTGGGNLNVMGALVAPGPVGNFQVTGTLGGAAVAVRVPEG